MRKEELLKQIAREQCRIETLETRNSDSLDFHDVSVWSLKAALEKAFEAGVEHGPQQTASPALSELNHRLTAFADSAAEECLQMLQNGETASLYLLGHAQDFDIDLEGNGTLWNTLAEMIGEQLEEHNLDMEIDNGDLVFTPRSPEMGMEM